MKLREYQQAAVDAAYEHLRTRDDNPCIVVPTGGGKSPIMGQIVSDVVNVWGGRVLLLAHTKELLEQNIDKIKAICPGMEVGAYSAGLRRRDTQYQVIVAGIQSVYRKACDLDAFDVILVDEAHLIPPGGEGMYRQFLSDMKIINPAVRVIGLTATAFRTKEGELCSPGGILNHVCFEIGVRELIDDGYLSNLISKSAHAVIDTSGVAVRGGEFVADQLETAADEDGLVKSAVDEIVSWTRDGLRKATLIFATGVKHGRHIVETFREKYNLECGFVSGDTPSRERAELLARFRGSDQKSLIGGHGGVLRYLCNVNVLTTGFDAPHIDCVSLLRPTMSPGLYYQMVGRGFRLSPNKLNCIAEGQRVLTDVGLVCIENVTTEMKVWDGCEFVEHNGAICHGEKSVIGYAGLVATGDHRAWTKEGWKTLRECAEQSIPISVTGDDEFPVELADCRFRNGVEGRSAAASVSCNTMHGMQSSLPQRLLHNQSGYGGLPKVWSQETSSDAMPGSPQMAVESMHISKATMKQAKRRVWDILNAGPRHRFTCEGLLVSNCLVLDFGGNVERHGPVDALRVKSKKRIEGGTAPEKSCPECGRVVPASAGYCAGCGFQFPPPDRNKHDPEATAAGVLSGQKTISRKEVQRVSYRVHVKKSDKNAPKSMRVEYWTGLTSHQCEWICFEHAGFARDKAEEWWARRCKLECPATTAEAVQLANQGHLTATLAITVEQVAGDPYATKIKSHELAIISEPEAVT